MHSLPTTSTAGTVKCVALKHKLPIQLRHKKRRTTTANVPPTATTTPTINASPPRHVDEDLLATVLRVALETRLRREQLCKRPNHALAARALQSAVTALNEEPMVREQLTAHKAQFGFRDALGQLGRCVHAHQY